MTRVRELLRRSPTLATVFPYVGTLIGVALVVELLHFAPLPKPVGGVLSFAVVMVFAWIGGFKPALFIAPLLLFLARLTRDESDRWTSMESGELVGFAVVMLITATTGLAGQYRRRVQAVTAQHAQKLKDQARALSHAAIAYRSNDGRIMDWSHGAERLCGWSSGEANGRFLHELLDTHFPEPRSIIDEKLASSGQWQGEVGFRHKDGTQLRVAAHWILYRDKEDTPIGVAEVWTDVTELRRAEAAIRDADKRKEDFLAMLAHELRNPLAPIRTGVDLLKVVGDDREQLEATCAVIERQMKQLVRLIDDLLDVSRISRGKFELRCTNIVLSDVISSAVEAMAPAIEAARHKLSVNLPATPVSLKGDPNRLAQVVSNLLDNAAKYTPPGGNIDLSVTQDSGRVTLVVADNGTGISSDSLDDVFGLFRRNVADGASVNSGLGIGLALVKSIVEMHGGSVVARSDGPGRGSQFVVVLPALNESPRSSTGQSPRKLVQNGHARRVLVVDDNHDAASMLSVLISKLGNEVRTAHDGLEAIAEAEQFRPEIVLLDLGMPRLDGYGAARQIRAQPWGKEMILVALTGWGQDSDRQRTAAAGFNHHLVKPADPVELSRLLSNSIPQDSFSKLGVTASPAN